MSATNGKPDDASRWVTLAELGAERRTADGLLPDGSPTIGSWLSLLRALLCRDGVEQMRADAEHAVQTLAAGSFWRGAATVQARVEPARCHLALSDIDAARTLLREADEILARRPGLGVFTEQANDLRTDLPRPELHPPRVCPP